MRCYRALFFLAACNKAVVPLTEFEENKAIIIKGELPITLQFHDNEGPHDHNFSSKLVDGFAESFESDSKTTYEEGTINLSTSGSWYLSDALLGATSNDRKYGAKSLRIREEGYAIMSNDMDNGVHTIRVRHAKYGSDGASSWRLIVSYDRGGSWFYAGDTVTTSSITLNTITFTLNETDTARYGIYKTGGGANRVNFDSFEVNTSSATPNTSATRDSNLTFGNPSNANTSSTNYYLSKPDYALSYNTKLGTPNWVSWHLSSAWTGDTPRCNCFKSDSALPNSFFKATTSDYTNSGFDRGHLCASADRAHNAASNASTYLMINIAPQAPDNNQRAWASFENYLRKLTLDGNEVHIISGVIGRGGKGANGTVNTLANGAITVPDSFWKVALVLPNGSNDISRVTTSTRIIAINVPNDQGINSDWGSFRTTVNRIENLTGYDLFENIKNSLENVLESRVDNGPSS